ncbi:MAG: DUF2813 domain-containing protein [Spirochaetaceae bacterium]|nr:DUF2813 domain-containing protein [Spirochaetaceae bacterium]
MRDIGDEFSPRSQFWGRLLKALEIPPDLESHLQRVLDHLNRRLLDADPRLQQIAETLSSTTRISARDRDGGLDLRMAPLKTWDLLSKAEIILRNEPDWPWLPLQRQGQGVQSLSVIFLFQAFVEHLLRELYERDSQPVLALEEPETHLHPQAARTLWMHVRRLPGQKIITTHSPYFVQHVPFRDLRLVRLSDQGTEVRSLPASFSATVPQLPGLDRVVGQSNGLLRYEKASRILTVRGALDQTTYRALLTCCGTHPDRSEVENALRELRDRSSRYVADDELQSLETFARRMRGEIFFAERWMIVEGQADFLIVYALAEAMQYDLDEHGVSLIDAQNNGNPDTFAVLARALGIPWIAVFDGDDAGNRYVQAIRARGFADNEVQNRCLLHRIGNLEAQLVADGLSPELREILTAIGVRDVADSGDDVLSSRMREHKTAYAAALAERIRVDANLAARTPEAFRTAVGRLQGLG